MPNYSQRNQQTNVNSITKFRVKCTIKQIARESKKKNMQEASHVLYLNGLEICSGKIVNFSVQRTLLLQCIFKFFHVNNISSPNCSYHISSTCIARARTSSTPDNERILHTNPKLKYGSTIQYCITDFDRNWLLHRQRKIWCTTRCRRQMDWYIKYWLSFFVWPIAKWKIKSQPLLNFIPKDFIFVMRFLAQLARFRSELFVLRLFGPKNLPSDSTLLETNADGVCVCYFWMWCKISLCHTSTSDSSVRILWNN